MVLCIQVAGTLQSRFTRTPALVVHLTEARRRLAGEVTSDLLSMPNNNFLEGAILLEELTKVSESKHVSAYVPIFSSLGS